MKRYDAILVGSGHNGLTCAAYLARAGLRVLVCERRHIAGGPSAEYEYFPGYRASITNSPGSLEPKVVADLELERHGLKFTRPDPTLMFPFPDGRAFIGWRDHARVMEQIRRFSARDVDGYAALFDFLNRFGRTPRRLVVRGAADVSRPRHPPRDARGRRGVRQGVPRQRRRPAGRGPGVRAHQVDARDARSHVELAEPAVPRLRDMADDASDVARIVEHRGRARPAPPSPARLHGAAARGNGELREGCWSIERDRFGEHCIDVLAEYLPGLRDRIVDRRFGSPADLEAEFGLPGANITHLDMTPRHMFGLRPLAGFSDYRSPIAGLYACGSSTWPGGTVTGAPGHNASQRVLVDLERGAGRPAKPGGSAR